MLDILKGKDWHVHHGDCVEHMATLPDACMDMAIFSPPFPSLFAYTSEASDVGNCTDLANEAKLHFSFFFRQFARLLKPGRVVVVHCMQIPPLMRNGEVHMWDFRGILIRLGMRAGLVYDTDIPVTKNPQAQAIRTHSHQLLFVTLERDRAETRPAINDYLIKFRAPGENQTPINSSEISRNEWINWAEGVWDWQQIKETDTLNTAEAKGEQDTKHICPLQLGVIKRCVKLWTNPEEIVFSPFTGVGSEGYVALQHGRRFYGCELKDEYYETAKKNLKKAVRLSNESMMLF